MHGSACSFARRNILSNQKEPLSGYWESAKEVRLRSICCKV